MKWCEQKVANDIQSENETSDVRSTVLVGCPHCGAQPKCTVLGTQIEIWHCAVMSRQKCDYLTIEERLTWDNETLMYSDKAERKAFEAVAAEWNMRS